MKNLLLILTMILLTFGCRDNPVALDDSRSQLKYEVFSSGDTTIVINGTDYTIDQMALITEPEEFSGRFVQIVAWSYSGAVSVKISQRKGYASEWLVLGEYQDKKENGFSVASLAIEIKN